MLKDKVTAYLNRLMQEFGDTQEGISKRLDIPKTTFQRYLKGESLPRIEELIRIVELGGNSLDDLVKKESPTLHIAVTNSHHVAIGGDININQKNYRRTEYRPGPDDITGDQANKLKDLVNKIVEIEKETKKKPKTHGAIWNALHRKLGVTYLREIKRDQYSLAEAYLMQWIGRIKKGLKRTDAEAWRKDKQAAIFAAARNNLGWTKEALDGYIYERFKKESIRDLTKTELQKLYNAIFARKNS